MTRRNIILAVCFFLVLFTVGFTKGKTKLFQFDHALIQYEVANGFIYRYPTEVFHNTPGMIILKVSGTCPPGFTEDTSFDGRALIGTTIANGDVATNTGNATQSMTVANNVTLLGLGSALTGPTSINLTPPSRRVIVCTN